MRQPRLIARPFPKRKTVAVVLASLLLSGVVATQSLQAQTLRALHAFRGPDGEAPAGRKDQSRHSTPKSLGRQEWYDGLRSKRGNL